MKKLTAFAASLLFLAAGAAQAGTSMLIDGSTTYQWNTNSDTIATFTLPSAQTVDLLVDFTLSYTGTQGNNDFLGFWFGSATGASFGMKANCGDGSCQNDIFGRTSGSSGNYVTPSVLQPNTSYHVVGYLHKTGGSATYNTLDVWLDPTAQEMASLTGYNARATGSSGLSSITAMGFRTANIDNGVSLSVSDVNVSAVPEPASLALMGIAAAGMGALRRRKQA